MCVVLVGVRGQIVGVLSPSVASVLGLKFKSLDLIAGALTSGHLAYLAFYYFEEC